MESFNQTTNRRTVLQRGLAVLAGVLGMQVVENEGRAAGPPGSSGQGRTLRFYAHRWQLSPQGQQPGEIPAWHGQLNRQGELFETDTDKMVGVFLATCFSPQASFGARTAGAASLELQTFQLAEGTLFGMGAANPNQGEQVHAILGGTGLFTGVKGSYVVKPMPAKGKQQNVEITITILT